MDDQKWFIIANPAAGNGYVNKKLPSIENLMRLKGINYVLEKTAKKGDGIALTVQGIQKGYRNILAIGGDGTNNEVVNGIMQQNFVPSQDITYSVFSIGTGNDWIKTHSIPKQLNEFIDMLVKRKTTFQDIGIVEYFKNETTHKRFFANIAGMAYDAFLVKKTENLGSFFSNKLFYLISLLRYLFQYKLQKAKIRLNDIEISDYFYTINVGIGRYAGGGMEILPHAVHDDGQLAVTIAKRFSKWEILLNTYRFYNGSIAELSKISTHFSTKVQVESLESAQIPVEADGEYLGCTPVEFNILPKALKILIP